tara:strand:+ start:1712 stop:2155 length:444 start_codon:yes stop_codon:yes gene_type:complete
MSREKETIHLTATSRGWASKGGKGLGFSKKSKSSFVKKTLSNKNQTPSKGKDETPPKKDEQGKGALSFDAWLMKEEKAGKKYESKTAAQKGYDIYTGKAEAIDKPKEKPKTHLTPAYTLWLTQNGVKDSEEARNKYSVKTGKKPLNP